MATEAEVLVAITNHELSGSGIGYVDAQLVTATMLTSRARLWTKDKRLARVAATCGVGHRTGAN